MILTTRQESLLGQLASILNVPRDNLYNLINFESAWNPLARNKSSGARGLIQFMHKTAREMGFKDADDLVNKYPTIESQLEYPVYNYLKKYSPFSTKQSLYMSVFYPAYRNVRSDTVFNDQVKKQNSGIITVQDYVDLVEGKKKTHQVSC
jgi:hypothetical protein